MRNRGLTPVVGVALLIVIVLILSAFIAISVSELSEETDPQPAVALSLEATDDEVTYTIRHVSGEPLSENRTELRGVADEEALHGAEFTPGEAVEVVPVSDEVTLVWHGDDTAHVVQTFEVESVPYDIDTLDHECQWVESNIEDDGDLEMSDTSAACSVTGDTDTGEEDIDVDLATGSLLIGDIDTDGDVDIDDSEVAGDVATDADDITVTEESTVYGDVVARPGTNTDIDGGSRVTGDVVVEDGSLTLDDATIEGDVYVDEDDFTCSSGTIGPDEVDCTSYTPKDPADY
ncbi:MAG: type IV pilin N-terminal domain-containing protein [Natronomonas sp.]